MDHKLIAGVFEGKTSILAISLTPKNPRKIWAGPKHCLTHRERAQRCYPPPRRGSPDAAGSITIARQQLISRIVLMRGDRFTAWQVGQLVPAPYTPKLKLGC